MHKVRESTNLDNDSFKDAHNIHNVSVATVQSSYCLPKQYCRLAKGMKRDSFRIDCIFSIRDQLTFFFFWVVVVLGNKRASLSFQRDKEKRINQIEKSLIELITKSCCRENEDKASTHTANQGMKSLSSFRLVCFALSFFNVEKDRRVSQSRSRSILSLNAFVGKEGSGLASPFKKRLRKRSSDAFLSLVLVATPFYVVVVVLPLGNIKATGRAFRHFQLTGYLVLVKGKTYYAQPVVQGIGFCLP